MFDKRLTVFSGHYGSGKTNVAVNYATALADLGQKVSIYDLDIVNPYFRTVDAEKNLAKNGVDLIVSPFAESNVDLPSMSAGSYKMLDKNFGKAVIDLGGDDRGALAMGRFCDKIKEENDYDMFFVVNTFRPLTQDASSIMQVKNEIENACKLKFTAVINNSNLGLETNEEDVLCSVKIVEEFCKNAKIPLKFTTVSESLYDKLKGEIDNLYPLKMQKKL